MRTQLFANLDLWITLPGCALHADYRSVNMPEIASAIRKLDGNFSIPEVRLNVNDAAFALFFCNDINEQKSLPLFDLRFQGQEPAVDAYGIGFDSVAERTVVRRSSIHSNRYSEIPTL